MRCRTAIIGLLTIGSLVSASGPALAQYGVYPGYGGFSGFSPAERVILFGLGTRRISRGDFMRQLYALNTMDRSYLMRQQQFVRQQMAAQRARTQQAQLQGLMAGARRPAAPPYPATPPTPEQSQEVSDFLIVWEVLGCTFDAEVTDAVKAVDPKYDAGMRVAAIQVGGPADRAGWKAGDVLVGLYKYRTRTYDNVAYVADLPDIVALSPMRAILLHDGKLVEMPLDFRQEANESKPAEPATDEPAKPGNNQSGDSLPASPIATDAEPGGVQPTSGDEPTKAVAVEPSAGEKLWQELGIRCQSVKVTSLGAKFDRGLKITEIRDSSPAAKLGWKVGDVLIGLGGYQTRILLDADYVLSETRPAGSAKFILLSGNDVARGTVEYATGPQATNPDAEPAGGPEPDVGAEPEGSPESP